MASAAARQSAHGGGPAPCPHAGRLDSAGDQRGESLLGRLAASTIAGDAPGVERDDAIAEREQLRQVAGGEQDRRCRRRRGGGSTAWISAFAPTSTPAVGSSSSSRRGRVAQGAREEQLLLIAAGERVDRRLAAAGCGWRGARSTRRSRSRSAPTRRRQRVGGQEEVLAQAQRRHQALARAILGHEHRRARRLDPSRRAAGEDRRSPRAPRCVPRRPDRRGRRSHPRAAASETSRTCATAQRRETRSDRARPGTSRPRTRRGAAPARPSRAPGRDGSTAPTALVETRRPSRSTVTRSASASTSSSRWLT